MTYIQASTGPTLAASASLTWGTVSVATRKSITCSSTGSDGSCRLKFTGTASAYKIMSIDGDDLTTPTLCSAGALVIGIASGSSNVVQIEAIYTDGTQKAMTVTALSAAGDTVATLAATATYADAYLGAVTDQASHIGLWSPRDVAVGTKASTAVLMTDVSGKGEGNIQHVLTSGTAWSVDAVGPAVMPSLSSCVTTGRAQSSAYGVITAALAAGAEAGMFWGRWPTAKTNWQAWVGLGGVVGAPAPGSDFVAFSDSRNGYNVAGGSGTATIVNSSIAVGEWFCFAWRRSGGTTYTYLSEAGLAWKSAGESSSSTAYTQIDELRLGYYGNAAGSIQIAGVALFSTDVGEAGLQDIFEAV
jgi:hypothetical protein